MFQFPNQHMLSVRFVRKNNSRFEKKLSKEQKQQQQKQNKKRGKNIIVSINTKRPNDNIKRCRCIFEWPGNLTILEQSFLFI